ncbi:MAG TPA: ATP-binding cassette domain-containing protein [Candidatus Omnitrophota bacterium]|nr:ATP-binding cassette domain-containing protein [Candidatus Omnitrophota bacterium]HPD84389.1 ATP-binding cassette domain-containing protein [Candidatus Omnitrophota bacterium]HRZ03247.1 ATP-binding cassette domain-containing protein [Candidatus Omnitrophota bacterium]
MNTSVAIDVRDLSRHFGKFIAVDKVNFSIDYGEIFGFLGPNGAGKSTTIRMLCGILASTGGTASVGGFDVNRQSEQIKEVIGYVSQRFSLYNDLTAQENLEFYGRIYGITGKDLDDRIEEILRLTGLQQWRHQLAGILSGGMKQKLALANAILHKPKVLFLDEPTAGIDPLSRRALWELLYQIADSGVALFVTTHYMEEAERCSHIAFISQGRILKIGRPNDLKDEMTGTLLEVECSPLMKASSLFQKIAGVKGVTAFGTTLHLNTSDMERVKAEVLNAARSGGIDIKAMRPIGASLEDVFASLSDKQDEKH